jgi:cell division protein FtsA
MLGKLKHLKKTSQKSKVNDNEQLIVSLDIGTEFVKALVARITEENGIEILGVGRAHQTLNDMQAGAIADIAGVVANCDIALNQAEKQAGVSARSAVVGIAGELVRGNTTTVKFSRKNPNKEIDVAEVDNIFSHVQERALEQAKKELSVDTGGKQIGLKLVNSALISIEIDGYSVTNPVGFQGKDVSVQLYTAFAPQVHFGAIERVAHQLDLDLLTVAAEPFAVARAVIGDDPNANLSAILIDIGGGTTDIAVVNEGGVEGTKMFGIGGRSYTKSVEKELGTDFERAESLKLGLSNDRTPEPRRKPVEAALKKTLTVWLNGIELALEEFTKLDHLPHRILLCGGGAGLEMISDSLNRKDWYSELPFTKKPQVQLISPDQVVGIVDTTGIIEDHTFITAMGLLRVGMDSLVQYESSSKSVRDRLNRMLKI